MRRLVFIGLACISCLVCSGQNLNRIEYFIDTEPGYGNGTNVPFTAAATVNDLTFSVPVTALTDGMHVLYVRSRDVNNKWSIVQGRPFYKFTVAAIPNLDKVEYFIDTEPGYGSGTDIPITAGTTVTDLAVSIPVTTLTDGIHTLYLRSRDVNGRWSVVQGRPFFKFTSAAAPNLTRIEYFVDTDPGFGLATSVTFTAGASVTDLAFSVDVSALSAGAHKLYVRSKDANSKWSIIQVKDFSVCNAAAPVSSPATAISTTSFTSNWGAVASATGYKLDVSADNFVTLLSGYNDLSVSGITQAVSGLTVGKAYKYRVRAIVACTSVNSAAIDVTTLFTTPVAASATGINGTGFIANWGTVTNAASYRLDISTDNFVTFITGYDNKTVSGITETITGLSPSTAYKYRVRAVNAGSAVSASSNVITATTLALPAAPVASAATIVTSTGFTANWSAVAGATGYRLDVSADNFINMVTGFSDKIVTGTSDVVTGLTAATAYKYRLRAVNVNGTSVNSNIIDVTTSAAGVAPVAPVAIAATSISSTGFSANWNIVSGATGYQVDMSLDNFITFLPSHTSKSVTGTTDAVTSLAPNTVYKYRIRATNAFGVSANSNVIDVTTLPLQTAAPAAVAATDIIQTGFTANWTAVAGATGYQVDVSADNFVTFTAGFDGLGTTGVSSLVTGLTAGTAYKYRVRATSALPVSLSSNVIDVLTLPKSAQTITFGAISDKTLGDGLFPAGATASSGLAVSYATASDKITISAGQVTIVKAGRDTIEASQAGNATFNAAATVIQSFCIKPAKPVITINGANTDAVTLTSNASAGNQWFKDGTLVSGATNVTFNATTAGVYKVQVKVDDCVSVFSSDVPLVVTGVMHEIQSGLNAFPNPTSGKLFVDFRAFDNEKSVELKVTDNLGRAMFKQSFTGGTVEEIDVTAYPAGYYFLTAVQEAKSVQFKFVRE